MNYKVLYTKYIDEHKSMKVIGKELDCSSRVVHSWLHKYNIPIKPVGKTYKVWNKGLTKEINITLKNNGKKISKAKKGKTTPWNKGLTKSDHPGIMVSSKRMQKRHDDGLYDGENNPFYGKFHTKEWSKEQSIRKGGTGNPGEYTEYGEEFTYKLKEFIRVRDNRTCQECGLLEIDNNKGKKLEVHHIDFDKENNNEDNLISLCKGCHTATLSNKEYWISKYTKVLT